MRIVRRRPCSSGLIAVTMEARGARTTREGSVRYGPLDDHDSNVEHQLTVYAS